MPLGTTHSAIAYIQALILSCNSNNVSCLTANSFILWSGYAFENICVLHMHQIKSALELSVVNTKTSSWMFKGSDEMPGAQ